MNFRSLTMGTAVLLSFSVSAYAAEIRLNGSSAVTDHLLQSHLAEIESASGHRLLITETTPTDGVMDLVTDIAPIAMIYGSLDSVVTDVNNEIPDTVTDGLLQAHKVGEARVAFTVNTANSVRELSHEQIRNILNGTTTNWNQLGGADQPIIVIIERADGSLRTIVEKQLMEDAAIEAKRREVSYAIQIPDFVEGIPNALGVMSAADVDGNITEVQTDATIKQDLFFVTKVTPSADVLAVINAAKTAGGISD